jgi:hypothetical protein
VAAAAVAAVRVLLLVLFVQAAAVAVEHFVLVGSCLPRIYLHRLV